MTASNVSRMPAKKSPAKKAAAAKAREAEAEDNGHVVVEHRGVTLRIPVRGKVPIAAVDAFRDGDNYAGTKLMLGAEQWKRLSDAGMTVEELDELGAKLQEATGN